MKIYLVTTEYTNSEGSDVFTIPCASKEAALRKLQECIENELFFIAKELCDGFVSEDELAKGGYFRYNSETKRYIGDSYRDLTRIAMINENLWSELFLGNKEYLLAHIKSFEHELDLLKNAIQNEDKKALQELFISATKIRKEMEK